eukprot:Cvel_23036.t1-p1 / transcript=Cvel_23036.t1 / gene=Cvel_23036 / organism=Chromera_velia_CCMP2878 / gene_product=Laccase-2, putative / transcript_product=Laccase-2, putative / location=Cvel_scaffold2328:28458-30631(+) / protein_length=696 / sequence_SO=supercontig / SO=protein_coding / is_pseudo=false
MDKLDVYTRLESEESCLLPGQQRSRVSVKSLPSPSVLLGDGEGSTEETAAELRGREHWTQQKSRRTVLYVLVAVVFCVLLLALSLSKKAKGGGGAGSVPIILASPLPHELAPLFFRPEVRESRNGLLETTLDVNTCKWGGLTTRCYEGRVPGPSLVVRPGDTLRLTLKNRLTAKDLKETSGVINTMRSPNVTNLHVHGFHVSSRMGQDDVFDTVVSPLTSFTYEYHIPDSHSTGVYWYHPHFHGAMVLQAAGGMLGGIYVASPHPYNSPVAPDTVVPAKESSPSVRLVSSVPEVAVLHMVDSTAGSDAGRASHFAGDLMAWPPGSMPHLLTAGIGRGSLRTAAAAAEAVNPISYFVNGVLQPQRPVKFRCSKDGLSLGWERFAFVNAGPNSVLLLRLWGRRKMPEVTSLADRESHEGSSAAPPVCAAWQTGKDGAPFKSGPRVFPVFWQGGEKREGEGDPTNTVAVGMGSRVEMSLSCRCVLVHCKLDDWELALVSVGQESSEQRRFGPSVVPSVWHYLARPSNVWDGEIMTLPLGCADEEKKLPADLPSEAHMTGFGPVPVSLSRFDEQAEDFIEEIEKEGSVPPRHFVFNYTVGPQGLVAGLKFFGVNGKSLNPCAAPVRVALGELVEWKIINAWQQQHPFHLHGHKFQIKSVRVYQTDGGGDDKEAAEGHVVDFRIGDFRDSVCVPGWVSLPP